MKIPTLLLITLILALMPESVARSEVAAAERMQPARLTFDSLFSRGVVLEDLNGDGTINFVNVRIVVPMAASTSEIAAATEIAARLGYETTATDLSLVATDADIDPSSVSQPLILIGRTNKWTSTLASKRKIDLGSLGPGQGAAVLVRSAFGSNDALVLVGSDDSGIANVGKAVASRFPFVGMIGGPRFATVESDIDKFLTGRQISTASASKSVKVVADSGWETSLVSVGVTLSSEKDFRTAEQALRTLTSEQAQNKEQNTLRYAGLRRLEIQLSTGTLQRAIAVNGPTSPAEVVGPAQAKTTIKPFDLAQLYSVDGLFGDSNNDLIPDTSSAALVLGHGSARPGVAELGARLGLESAGISLPLTRQVSSLDEVPNNLHPIVIEDKGTLSESLRQGAKLRLQQQGLGEGLIQVVPRPTGSAAILVTGGDQAGVDAALDYVADRLPHLGERGKGKPTLGDIGEEARAFFDGRSEAGQAAMAVYKLDRMVGNLKGKSLDHAGVKIYIDDAPPAFKSFLESRLRSQGVAKIDLTTGSLNIRSAVPVFEENETFPWEVDDFWKLFQERVLSAVKKGSQTTLEVRVNESPEIRTELAQKIRSELQQKSGRADANVTVLSAHKAAFTWLTEVVEPAVRGKDIGRILIRFAELKPVNKWQLLYSKTRWLQELFPVDEILARDLGIPLSAVEFEEKSEPSPTYEVLVTDKRSKELYRGQMDGKLATRPFFDQFPDYDTVQVDTGWITSTVDGTRVVDERIVTDLEKFWDHYQKVTLPRVYNYVMDLYDGKPRARYAPYFGELRIDLSASEANYRLGIDQEIFSPMDALSEDIYFDTLAFFDTMGLRVAGEKLWHPGRILPYMRPSDKGGPAKLVVHFTGKPAGFPQVVLNYQEQRKQPIEEKEAIDPADVARPRVTAVVVRHGEKGIERVVLACKVNTAKDEREELLRSHNKEDVNRLVMSQEQAAGMVRALVELQKAGLYTDAFGYGALHNIDFLFQSKDSESMASFQSTGKKRARDLASLTQGYQYHGEQIVQWDNPVNPGEAEQIIAKLGTFPEITTYHAGHSYMGRDIWAFDLMLPVKASHWSQAKLSTVKPVVIFNARQHGNETSGTSHLLRLAELIATKPEYKQYLKRVNIAMLPITNPDGAAFARELAAITPDFILHAGYFAALGTDMTAQQWSKDPIYPEAKVRPEMWRTWLPDLFIDPHGSPQHEWLQIFAGYPAWVISRTFLLQDWAIPRGWWTSVRWVEGPEYPHHKEVSLALRDYVIDGVRSVPEVLATNARMDSRFDRYGRFEPEIVKSEYYRGIRVSEELRAFNPDAPAASPLADLNIPLDFAERFPNVTVRFGHRTESPDETARGDWLKVFASAGLQFDLASVRYLYDSAYEIKHIQERDGTSVHLATIRTRPPLPGKRSDLKTEP
jgi:hypothetical protein